MYICFLGRVVSFDDLSLRSQLHRNAVFTRVTSLKEMPFMNPHESKSGSPSQPAEAQPGKKVSKGTVTSFLGSCLLLCMAMGLFLYLILDHRSEKTQEIQGDQASSAQALERTSGSAGSPRGLERLSQSQGDPSAQDSKRPFLEYERGLASSGGSQEAPLDSQDEEDIHKALEALDQGNLTEASQILEGVLKRDPSNERALVEMAMMQLLDLKQPELAVKYLQRAYDVNPSNMMVTNELVSLFEEQGKLEEGIQFFTEQVQKRAQTPGASEVAYGAGQMMMIAGRDQEALGYLQKAVEGEGAANTRAWNDLAEAYSRLGDHAKAIDSYQKSITAQQKLIADQQSKGFPMQYVAERIGYTKMQLIREYIKDGQKEQAQALMEEVKQLLPGDDSVATLQKQISESSTPAKG